MDAKANHYVNDNSYRQFCPVCGFQHSGVKPEGHAREKTCNRCNKPKDLTAFPQHLSSWDGHRHTCSVCLEQDKARQRQEKAQRQSTHDAKVARREVEERERALLQAYGYRWTREGTEAIMGAEGVTTIWTLHAPEGDPTTKEEALAAIAQRRASAATRAPRAPLRKSMLELVALDGNERQAGWAGTIRSKYLRQLPDWIDRYGARALDQIDDVRLRLALLPRVAAAGWWINHKDKTIAELLGAVHIGWRGSTHYPFPRTRDDALKQLQRLQQFQLNRAIFLDTETTGKGMEDRLVQVAAVDANGRTVLDTFINPEVPIPPDATGVHRITDDMVRSAPTFCEVWPSLCALLRDANPVVIYNSQFDMGIIRRQAQELIVADPSLPLLPYGEALCAMRLYAAFAESPGGRACRLVEACTNLQVTVEDLPALHRAREDAEAARRLVRRMLDEVGPYYPDYDDEDYDEDSSDWW